MKKTIDYWIGQFIIYLEVEKNRSPLTTRNYRFYLRRFYRFLKKKSSSSPTLKDINMDNVRQFRLYLSRMKTGRGSYLKKITQGYHLIALRSFLRWLTKMDMAVMAPEKIELPRVESRSLKFLNAGQVERLLQQPNSSSLAGLRDRAILETLFSTGLRVSELVSLNRDQVNFKTGELGVIGKGGRNRLVFLSKRARYRIERYLVARNDRWPACFIRYSGKKDDPVSLNEGGRLSVRSVQRLIKKYRRRAGIAVEVTPHVLRHSFATDLLVSGADIRSVQELLGHKNIATTQIYTHVTDKRLREIHERFHSGNKKS